jgi:ribosome modulation factor
MADKPNSIAPNDFLAAIVELDDLTRGKDRSVAKLRTVRQRMEKQGTDMPALDLALSLRKLGTVEAEMRLRNALRYARWLSMEIGEQGTLFSDDADLPAGKAVEQYSEARIFDEGYKAGVAGRSASDHRHPQGTPAAMAFWNGWKDGQAFLAEQLGRPAEEGETLKPAKRQGKAKSGAAAASGKPRGRGGRRRGAAAHADI